MDIQKQIKYLVFLSTIGGYLATTSAQDSPNQYNPNSDPGTPAPNTSQVEQAMQLGNQFKQRRWHESVSNVNGYPIPQHYMDWYPGYSITVSPTLPFNDNDLNSEYSGYFQGPGYTPIPWLYHQQHPDHPGTNFSTWRPPNFHSPKKGHKP